MIEYIWIKKKVIEYTDSVFSERILENVYLEHLWLKNVLGVCVYFSLAVTYKESK